MRESWPPIVMCSEPGACDISTTSSGGARACQALGEINPYGTLTLADRGEYAAVSFGWFGEFVDLGQVSEVVEQPEPALSDFAVGCTGSALGIATSRGQDVPSVSSGEAGHLVIDFGGHPKYPITASLPAGECDSIFDCTERSIELTEADTTARRGTVRQFVWESSVRCVADGQGSISVALTDADGTRSNESSASPTCHP